MPGSAHLSWFISQWLLYTPHSFQLHQKEFPEECCSGMTLAFIQLFPFLWMLFPSSPQWLLLIFTSGLCFPIFSRSRHPDNGKVMPECPGRNGAGCLLLEAISQGLFSVPQAYMISSLLWSSFQDTPTTTTPAPPAPLPLLPFRMLHSTYHNELLSSIYQTVSCLVRNPFVICISSAYHSAYHIACIQ